MSSPAASKATEKKLLATARDALELSIIDLFSTELSRGQGEAFRLDCNGADAITTVSVGYLPATDDPEEKSLYVVVSFRIELFMPAFENHFDNAEDAEGIPVSGQSDTESEDAARVSALTVDTTFMVTFKLKKDLDERAMKLFAERDAVQSAWPYWRQHLSHLASLGDFGSLNAPVLPPAVGDGAWRVGDHTD